MAKKKEKEKDRDGQPAVGAAPWDKDYVPIEPAYTRLQTSMIERLRLDVGERLSGRRLAHVHNVAQTSLWLAAKNGVDLFEAEVAGLLHDWDKKLDAQELWHKVDAFAIQVPRRDEVLPVLHGLTAAASLPLDYPELPAGVFQAIARHTTGAVGMADLDMVVYVADMVEPGRSGEQIDELRELCRTRPIREVFALSVRLGLIHLLESGRFIYPAVLDVWNDCRINIPVSEK